MLPEDKSDTAKSSSACVTSTVQVLQGSTKWDYYTEMRPYLRLYWFHNINSNLLFAYQRPQELVCDLSPVGGEHPQLQNF